MGDLLGRIALVIVAVQAVGALLWGPLWRKPATPSQPAPGAREPGMLRPYPLTPCGHGVGEACPSPTCTGEPESVPVRPQMGGPEQLRDEARIEMGLIDAVQTGIRRPNCRHSVPLDQCSDVECNPAMHVEAYWGGETLPRATQPAHGDNEAALREALTLLLASPLGAAGDWLWASDVREALDDPHRVIAVRRAALSASAEPERGEGR